MAIAGGFIRPQIVEDPLKALDINVPAIVWSEWIEPDQKPKKRKTGAS